MAGFDVDVPPLGLLAVLHRGPLVAQRFLFQPSLAHRVAAVILSQQNHPVQTGLIVVEPPGTDYVQLQPVKRPGRAFAQATRATAGVALLGVVGDR